MNNQYVLYGIVNLQRGDSFYGSHVDMQRLILLIYYRLSPNQDNMLLLLFRMDNMYMCKLHKAGYSLAGLLPNINKPLRRDFKGLFSETHKISSPYTKGLDFASHGVFWAF